MQLHDSEKHAMPTPFMFQIRTIKQDLKHAESQPHFKSVVQVLAMKKECDVRAMAIELKLPWGTQ